MYYLCLNVKSNEHVLDVEDGAMWSTLPLFELVALRTFVLDLDVLDWEPEDSNIMQEMALSCLKILPPTIVNLHLQFYLIDIELATAECLLSETRWTVLDKILSRFSQLETFEIALNVKVFLGNEAHVSKVVDESLRQKFLHRLRITNSEYRRQANTIHIKLTLSLDTSCKILITLNLPIVDYHAPEMAPVD